MITSEWSDAVRFQVLSEAVLFNEIQKVFPANPIGLAGFASGLAMNGAGNLLYVTPGVLASGGPQNFVHCYTKNGDTWEKQADFVDPSVAATDKFGRSGIAIDSAGTKLVIGAHGDTATGCAVHFYTKENNVWVKKQVIQSPYNDSEPLLKKNFGQKIAMSANGAYLAIAAPLAGFNGAEGTQVGMVCIYSFTGQEWAYETEFRGVAGVSVIGAAVAFDGVGDLLMIGGVNPATNMGFVDTYPRNSSGYLVRGETLYPEVPEAGDSFGSSILIEQNGLVCYVGAPTATNVGFNNSGVVYSYDRELPGDPFILGSSLTPIDAADGALFGAAMALNNDFRRVLISAPNDSSMFPNGGAFYYFDGTALWW